MEKFIEFYQTLGKKKWEMDFFIRGEDFMY